MRPSLRKRDQLARCLFKENSCVSQIFMLSWLQNKSFNHRFSSFPYEISTVPSDLTQEKSPIPSTTPLSPVASRASVSDQSQTSDARVIRIQAQGQERDKSKHKFVYSKQRENEYPWVNPLENISLIVCFAETASITRYQAEVVFQFVCQFGPAEDSTLDNFHWLIRSK